MNPEKKTSPPLPTDPAAVEFVRKALEKHGYDVFPKPTKPINSEESTFKPPVDPQLVVDETHSPD